MLETRLDNVVYRLGFAASRAQARQLIRHGHFQVNGRRVNIPSFQVKPDDVVALKQGSPVEQVVRDATDLTASVSPWLQADHDNLTGKVLKLPTAGPSKRRYGADNSGCTRRERKQWKTNVAPGFQVPRITQRKGPRRAGSRHRAARQRSANVGNSLRRVLLSSLKGAPSLRKIEGVAHEFTNLKGVARA